MRTGFLILPYPLTNFEKQKYYQNESKFEGVYSRNNLLEKKDEAYIMNLDKYKSIRTHWIGLYMNGNKVIHFNTFGGEYIPKEIKKLIGNKNIISNIYRIQTCTWFNNVPILLYLFCIFYFIYLRSLLFLYIFVDFE